MKLYLHWLRHDLRRFRLMLVSWVLLISVYSVFLCWAHLHILTVSQDVLDWSKPVAIALGLVQCGSLFVLFNSDPAHGTRLFWKTRPPSGIAVAAVKLTVALIFFLVLPLAAWQLVLWLSVLPQFATAESSGGLTWGMFLFWTQALSLAVITLAASSASNGRVLYLRLLAVVGIPAGFFLTLYLVNPVIWRSQLEWMRFGRSVARGVLSPGMAAACLCGGLITFSALRWRRRPISSGWVPALLVPAASLAFFSILLHKPRIDPIDERLPVASSTISANIRLQTSLMRGLLSQTRDLDPVESRFSDGYFAPYDFTAKSSALDFIPRIQGLPAGCRATGRWLDLKLSTPDGASVEANPALTRQRLNRGADPPQEADTHLYLTEAVFSTERLRPFYGKTCTASGTVRLTIYEEQRRELPVPATRYRGPDLSPFAPGNSHQPAVSTSFAGGTLERSYLFTTWLLPEKRGPDIFLENTGTSEKLSLATSSTPTTGFFVNYRAVDSSATLYGNEPMADKPSRWPGALHETAETLSAPGSGWQVGMRWHEPVKVADIPVTLEDINIPFWEGGPVKPAKAFMQLRLTPGSTDFEIRSTLRRAWFLSGEVGQADYFATIRSGHAASTYNKSAVWQRFLADFDHHHLPMLVEMFEELHWDKNNFRRDGTDEIRERIRELILPSDVPAIRQQFPTAAETLKDILPTTDPNTSSPAITPPAVPK